MTEQATIPGLEKAPTLTERQAQALAIIRELGPIRSEDLGVEMYPRMHDLDRARSYGRSVGDALAAKGLVAYVRGEGWVDAKWAEPSEPSAQVGPDGEWPEEMF